MASKIALLALVIILGLVNWSIAGKETHLAEGRIAYLELAPVDPRSLMQGDYMALNFHLSDKVYMALPRASDQQAWRPTVEASDGYVIVSLDERDIATFKGLYKEQALAEDEMLVRYRVRNGAVKFATNAFFFQEGHGKYYQSARYGQFRVDDRGELLLVAMYDRQLNKLGPDDNE